MSIKTETNKSPRPSVLSVRSSARHDGDEFVAGGEQQHRLRRVSIRHAAAQERQQQSGERPGLSGSDADVAGARQRVSVGAHAALQRLFPLAGRFVRQLLGQPGSAADAAPGGRPHVQSAVQPGRVQLQLRADGTGFVRRGQLAKFALPGWAGAAGVAALLAALLERQPESAAFDGGRRGRAHAPTGGHGHLAGARLRRDADQDAHCVAAAEHQTRRHGRLEALLEQGKALLLLLRAHLVPCRPRNGLSSLAFVRFWLTGKDFLASKLVEIGSTQARDGELLSVVRLFEILRNPQ